MKEIEKDIERGILHYLSSIPTVFVWKVNTVGVFDSKRGIYRMPNSPFIIRGVSDIIGVVTDGEHRGKIITIECKRPSTKKRLTKEQSNFLLKIKESGGFSAVCCSVEEVQDFLLLNGIINGQGMSSL